MLYSVKTGERIDAPSEQWRDLLSTGEYNFDPNTTVPFSDAEGKIVEVSGAEASNYILNPYATNLKPASRQQISEINRQATYGGVWQQALTGVESLASGLTLGLSRAATQKAVETTAGKEAGQRFTQAMSERQAANPATTIAAEVAGIILPTGAANVATKAGQAFSKRAVTPAIKSITENKLAQKAASKVGQYMAEGGVVDGVYEFSNQTIDENPYNAEAILDRSGEGALLNTIIGGGLEATIRGTAKGLKKVSEKTMESLGKLTGKVTDENIPQFYEVSGLELDRTESPTFPKKKTVKAEKTPEGYFYNDGKKRVKIDTDKLSGVQLSNPESANSLGAKYGIENFYGKQKNIRYSGEPLDEFIYRTSEIESISKDIENSFESLTPIDQERYNKSKALRESYATMDLDGIVTKQELRQIQEDIQGAEEEIRKIYEKTYSKAGDTTPSKDIITRGIEQRESRIAYEKSKAGQIPEWLDEQIREKYKDPLGTPTEVSDVIIQEERLAELKRLKKELKTSKNPELIQEKIDDIENVFSPNLQKIQEHESEIKRLGEILTEEERTYQKALRQKRADEIAESLGRFGYIDDGKNVYIDGDLINNQTFVAERIGARAKKSDLTEAMMAQYKPAVGKIKKFANEDLNEISEYLKSKYPNQLEKFKDVRTPVDFIYNQVKNDLELGIRNRADAIIRMNNLAENAGKQVRLTNKDISEFLENVVLPQYATGGVVDGKNAIVPKAGMKEQFNTIKKMIEEYKDSDVSVDPITGVRRYKELNVKEAIQKRVDLDRQTNWTTEAEKARNEANKEIRGFIEDKVAARASKIDPASYQKYLDAKKLIKNAIRGEEIISNAYMKALKSSGVSIPYFKLGIFGAAGGTAFGATGALMTAAIAGAADSINKNYSGNLKAYFSGGIAKEGVKFLNKIDLSAQKFLNTTGNTRRAIVAISGKSAEEQMEKDRKAFTEELQNAENFAEKFMEENDALIEMAPRTTAKILETIKASREFLLSKMPENPYLGQPYREKLWKPSIQDVQRYARYRQAVFKPSAILEQVYDGYVTPEAVEVLKTIYPETLNRLKEQILKQYEKGIDLPLEKRLQLQEIFDIPLETTPETFQVYQSNAVQATNQSIKRQQAPQELMTQGQQTQLPLGESSL